MPVATFIWLLAGFIAVCLGLLALGLIYPRQWATLIDSEHDFFVRCGLLPAKLSPHIKQLEKGIVLKLALAATAFIGLLDLATVILRYVLGFRI